MGGYLPDLRRAPKWKFRQEWVSAVQACLRLFTATGREESAENQQHSLEGSVQNSGANLSSDTARKTCKEIIKGNNFYSSLWLGQGLAASWVISEIHIAMFKATYATNNNSDLWIYSQAKLQGRNIKTDGLRPHKTLSSTEQNWIKQPQKYGSFQVLPEASLQQEHWVFSTLGLAITGLESRLKLFGGFSPWSCKVFRAISSLAINVNTSSMFWASFADVSSTAKSPCFSARVQASSKSTWRLSSESDLFP